MNSVHLHLMIVHIPIILVPLGAILLAFALLRKSDQFLKFGSTLFVASALFATAAFLTGDSSEEVVEDLPGVSEAQLESHEESADAALALSLALGALGLAGLAASRIPVAARAYLQIGMLLASLLTSGALAYAAQEGGKIRHPEAFSAVVGSDKGHEAEEDDD